MATFPTAFSSQLGDT